MSAASLIQLASSCVGVLGSLFFAIGIMRQSIEAMGRLSGTHFGWNPHWPAALAAQKADYLFGGCLLLVSFILQLTSFLSSNTPVLSVTQSQWAPWIAVILTVVVAGLLRWASRRVAQHYESKISDWLKKHAE